MRKPLYVGMRIKLGEGNNHRLISKTKPKFDMVKNTKVLDRWLTKCSKNIFVYFKCSKIQNSIYSMCDVDKQKCQFPFMSLLLNSQNEFKYMWTIFQHRVVWLYKSCFTRTSTIPSNICTSLSTLAIFLNT